MLGWVSVGFVTPTDDLLKAAAEGDLASVQRLLDRGANVNAKDIYGNTALTLA